MSFTLTCIMSTFIKNSVCTFTFFKTIIPLFIFRMIMQMTGVNQSGAKWSTNTREPGQPVMYVWDDVNQTQRTKSGQQKKTVAKISFLRYAYTWKRPLLHNYKIYSSNDNNKQKTNYNISHSLPNTEKLFKKRCLALHHLKTGPTTAP